MNEERNPPLTPFDAFKALTRKLVRVPKAELDKAEAEYQRAKAKRQKRRKPS
jgi:hypothetical protein